jgi:flagellar L-ring protein precursor FlgH
MKKRTLPWLIFALAILSLAGCAGFGKKMKSFLNGDSERAPVSSRAKSGVKFSQSPNVNPRVGDKQYRRVNREIFEKEGMLGENSGSLWVMEGQGSYLFSQNLMRVSGDVINISLDGVPRSSLEKKVGIIKTLLERNRRQSRFVASAAPFPGAAPQAQPGAAAPAPAAPANGPPNAQAPAPNAVQNAADEKADADEEKKSTFDVVSVPSRIVEKTDEGSYRIKGSQSFMIGRHEYRVIATGVVRPADIKNDSIESSKMVDSKFDIVAIKKDGK